MAIGGVETIMGADDFILGDGNKDFKNLKAYQNAMQMRDWQTCDHISENQELYFLKEENEKLKKEVERLKEYEWMYKDLSK